LSSTPARSVRIPEQLWKQVKAKAKSEHTSVSAIIIRLLVQWVE
jgi:predicted HicB family RNase H-like nuclease